jgi:hypothetical protein
MITGAKEKQNFLIRNVAYFMVLIPHFRFSNLYFLHPVMYHELKVYLRAVNTIDYKPILKF